MQCITCKIHYSLKRMPEYASYDHEKPELQEPVLKVRVYLFEAQTSDKWNVVRNVSPPHQHLFMYSMRL